MPKEIALIGTGPVGFGVIAGLAKSADKSQLSKIHIFDISEIFGAGLPYDYTMTDSEHLLNVQTLSTAFPNGGKDFFAWMSKDENKPRIRERFRIIHQERLEQALETAPDEATAAAYRESYANIWNSIEKKYLNLETGLTYHPRILFGIYQTEIFAENLAKIRASGIEIIEHRKTEATSLERAEGGKLILGFDEESIAIDECILATGKWQIKPKAQSSRYCSNVWPARELRGSLDKIIAETLAQREREGNPSKKFRVAIEGTSLSAIDALKTVHNHCPQVELEVDLISRNGTMPKVKCGKIWLKKFADEAGMKALADGGITLNQATLKNLAEGQPDQKLRLWQIILMTARAVELGYKTEGLDEKEIEARKFLFGIISQVKKIPGTPERTEAEANYFLSNLSGTAEHQAKKMKEFFGLDLDGANYGKILEQIQAAIFPKDVPAIELLKKDLLAAENGDAANGGLVWQNIYYQIDALTMRPFLLPEEEIFRFQILERIHNSLNNAMPIQTAKELIALDEEGVFKIVTLGNHSKRMFRCESGKVVDERTREAKGFAEDQTIIYLTEDEKYLRYDYVINSRGITYGLDSATPLYKSMAANGLITRRKVLFCRNEEMEEKTKELREKYGEESAEIMLRALKKDGENWFYGADIFYVEKDLSEKVFSLSSVGISGSISKGMKFAERFAVPSATVAGVAVASASVEEKKSDRHL